MKLPRILKSKWLWPLWFMLACILLAQGWRAGMATKCTTVWSPNRQFKVEYYFYGRIPIWDYYLRFMNSSYFPGFTRVTDKEGHVIERRDADNMSSICNTCILNSGRSVCKGNEKPDEYTGSLAGGGGGLAVVWVGRHRDSKEEWKVYWRNWQYPYFGRSEGEVDVETALPAPPED